MSGAIDHDDEQRDILLGFVEEGREMIDDAEPLIIDLERLSEEEGEIDLETVNTVFRLFHSLKGGASFLDLTTISGLTHEAETLLDKFRKGEGELESHHIDLMNRSCDFLRSLLDQIETEFHDHGREEEAATITKEIQQAIASLKKPGESAEEGSDEAPASTEVGEAPSEEEPSQEQQEVAASTESSEMNLEEFQLTISPEMVETFINEGSELLDSAEESMLAIEKSPGDQEQIQKAFRAIHSFKGNSGFLGYRDMERLSHGAESILDLFREGKLEPSTKVTNLILEIIDFLKTALSGLAENKPPNIPATPGLLHLLEDYSGHTLQKIPKKQEAASASESQPEDEKKPTAPPKAQKAETPKPAQPAPAAKSTPKPAVKSGKDVRETATSRASQVHQTVRVDVEKLDVLLDLVGELVISEAMVAQNPDIKGLDISLDRFDKAVMQLDKITRDLQDVSMSIRMIPLAGTFKRMVRLVRDLSQKAGKKVDLRIVGEETEVDKTVIEQITDPLVHIIRNAIDHGLETPADREAAGKDPTGTLTLEAKYIGGEVWINIEDDGRGLNTEKILKKAEERGLLEKDPVEYRDEEIWQFIFNPGFSTADKITDVSGRGVGMDVVRKNIESIRGRIDIRSVEGKGSVFTLRIPLTLAIIDGMIVRIGPDRYTLPITAIRESLQISEELVTRTMDGQEIIRVREKLYPVIRLHELLAVPLDHRPTLEEGIIMIVEDEGRVICLFVDELLGQQQIVIKGLSTYIGHHPCISGCTIMGDGDISLILDVAGTISYAEKLIPDKQVVFDKDSIPDAESEGNGNGRTDVESPQQQEQATVQES